MQHEQPVDLIDLDRVCRWYGSQPALRDVSVRLPRGRIGLLGPNGAGKSSLLKILLGLLPPSSGGGRVLGHDLHGDGTALRRLVGYMPEADALVPGLRGADYVALAGELYGMPRREAQRRAHEVLTYLGLEDARYRLLEEYSTGMKQRLKLAQALVHDPPLLLLDEPTSGLDPAGRDAMLRLLLTLGREHGKSILLSTHLLGDVERVCETVVILHHGRVLLQGDVGRLRTRRQDRYRLQIQGETAAFVAELRLEGARLLHDNGRGELRLEVPPGWTTRAFFALADNHRVLLRGLEADDEDLEELFHRVLRETPSPPTPLPRGERGEGKPTPLPRGERGEGKPTPLPRGERGEQGLPSPPEGGEGSGVRGERWLLGKDGHDGRQPGPDRGA